MLTFLQKPHPFIFNRYSIVIPGAATFLIIVLLAPFVFGEIEIFPRSFYALVIALFVAASIFTGVKLLQKLFPSFMKEDVWTVGREILLFLMITFLIVLIIFVCLYFLHTGHDSFVQLFAKTAFFTCCISIFPIVILVLFEQFRQQKIQLNRAQTLTQLLKAENEKLLLETQKTSISNPLFQLKEENGKVALLVHAPEIICLQSDGNYVEVFFEENQIITKKLIRNRLKNLEEQLPKTIFFRCHNRFLINGNCIVTIEGNARNLELTLRGIDFKVPVSRSKATLISDFLQSL
ncbi:LytTR family DNA-binding domain-containing protein [uncultured Kordia sp.]|uniref:LytR/AlgR family response regulator transcription factor n=1 Tax=uncultured Kordia sp. TaxID=507699 RepID=UPI002618F658|nr:LytTR family DNA-binding domain-containing protein [uncultured Kordia sp.]